MVKIKVIIFCFCFTFCGVIFAEDGVVNLSLEDAINYALDHNSQIKSQKTAEAISRIRNISSFNVLYPQVTLGLTLSRVSTLQEIEPLDFSFLKDAIPGINIVTPKAEEKVEKDRWTFGIDLRLGLNFSLQQITAFRANKQNYEMSKLTTQEAIWQTATQVKKQFYGILKIKEALRLMEENKKLLENNYDSIRQKYKSGFAQDLDYFRAEVSLKNLEPQYISLLNGYADALNGFKSYLGMDLDTKINFIGNISVEYVNLDANKLFEQFYKINSSVKELEIKTKLAQISKEDSIYSFIPTMSLGYNYAPTNSTVFRDEYKYTDMGRFTLSFSFPLQDLLPYSSSWNKYTEAKKNLKLLEDSSKDVKNAFRIKIEKAVGDLESSKKSIESLNHNLELSQRVYDKVLISYKNGLSSFSDLDKAQADLATAKNNVLNEKVSYLNILFDLENEINKNLIKNKSKLN